MSAETLRRAAALMRSRAEKATPGVWRVIGGGEYVAPVGIFVAPDDGGVTSGDAAHIASWHPAVALAVADWLDAIAEVHWPKRYSTRSESHYNAQPEHDPFVDCDEACWRDAFACNGCGTADCKPEIAHRALAVARAYLGED